MNNNQKILIVDDKKENLFALEKTLQETGVHIIKAVAGNEALTECLNHEFALAILDVRMPGMDGYELAEFIRGDEKTADLPIIFLSAEYLDDFHVFRGYEAGAVDYIVKPFNSKILVSKVKVFLNMDKQKSELRAYRNDLEQLVARRTAQLDKKNRQLSNEIKERVQAEERIQASLKEKEVLIKEIHHRVKNNLQVIASMLNLQKKAVDNQPALEALENSRNKIRSIALIHEKLYRSDDMTCIDFGNYARDITNHLLRSHISSADHIRLTVDVEDIMLGIDSAIPCGMIINELVTNSFKHAFPDNRQGKIHVGLKQDNGSLLLICRDNGVGIQAKGNMMTSESLGMQIVSAFIEQLDGKVNITTTGGTAFEIKFPPSTYDISR